MNSSGRQTHAWSPASALLALALATLAALVLSAVGGPVERAAAGACAHADSAINQASGKQLRKALTCLINADRKDRDRHLLDPNGKLEEAAHRHNKAMLKKNCWKHTCPGEPTLGKRIRNTGYLDGARRWRYAQNFGCAKTPQGMLSAWLGEDTQRENIRNRAYRDVGVGVSKNQVRESHCDDGDEVTYTVVFARRKG